MKDKSDDRVGNLNTILARGGENLNDPLFKSSNAQEGGGGVLKFRVDRRISCNKLKYSYFNWCLWFKKQQQLVQTLDQTWTKRNFPEPITNVYETSGLHEIASFHVNSGLFRDILK